MAPALMIIFSGCIHEYPHPVRGASDKGEDPTRLNAFIEVTFDLSWQQLIHHIDFDATETRVNRVPNHRLVLEVRNDEELICHDVVTLNEADFINGYVRHKLSTVLNPSIYSLAVWLDRENDEGDYSFDTKDLANLFLTNLSTSDFESKFCGYRSEILDLREEQAGTEKDFNFALELEHAGAGFEIVTTDIVQFINNNKEALNQGDSFRVIFPVYSGAYRCFNIFNNQILGEEEPWTLEGRMRLPYADYEELKIAEGFFFSEEESMVSAKLSVINSALVPIRQTDTFTFPVKRGHITTVTGNFLSTLIEGNFTIDNIWEGEIEFRYEESANP
ncbi:MAG: hypothetical protein J1F12_06440 [Muribaculaceae bacterium]|nr:hypothetical protein [Muribaculaceae bacterium]